MTLVYKLVAGFCLICCFFGAVQAQKKRSTKIVTKKPVIKAVVTVKGNAASIAPDPEETDVDLWNKFEIKDAGISVLLPAKSDRILDDTSGPVQSYQAFTKQASYMIVARTVGELIDDRNTSVMLEELMARTLDGNAMSEKQDIRYGDYVGKQFVYIDRGKRWINRVFLINGYLIGLSVSIKVQDYNQNWTKWIDKYFESLAVVTGRTEMES